MSLQRPAPAAANPGPRRGRRRFMAGAALTAILAVAAVGCGNSADPDTWAEAEDGDYGDYDSAVEENFMVSCLLANDSATGGNLNVAEAQDLCGCAFDGLRESLTLLEFKSLDKALRGAPNPSDLDEEPEDIWDDRAEEILAACADA